MRIMLEDIPEEAAIYITLGCLMCRQAEMVAREIGKILPQVVCGTICKGMKK